MDEIDEIKMLVTNNSHLVAFTKYYHFEDSYYMDDNDYNDYMNTSMRDKIKGQAGMTKTSATSVRYAPNYS